MADQGYGWRERPPMPDRFIPGRISEPRSQLPRNVAEVVKSGIPPQFVGQPQSIGVYTDHDIYTCAADTSEHTMKSLALAAGTIFSTSGGFKFRVGGYCAGTGGTKTVTLKFGGVTFLTASIATGTRNWLVEVEIWNHDSTREQRWRLIQWDGVGIDYQSINDDTTYALSVETA